MAITSSRYLFLERDVHEPIRFSSYGVMYGAKNIMTGEKVRIKVYEEKDGEKEKRIRFYKELYLFQELWDCHYLVQLINYRKMEGQIHHLVVENIPIGMVRLSGAVVEVRRIKSLFYQSLKTLESLHGQEMLFQFDPQHVYFDEDRIKVDEISGMVMGKNFDDEEEIITPLRYKAPELCLRHRAQNSYTNIWCLACIMAEVVLSGSLFICNDEDAIWNLLNQVKHVLSRARNSNHTVLRLRLLQHGRVDPLGADLIEAMMVYNPRRRLTVRSALNHPYFDDLDKDAW